MTIWNLMYLWKGLTDTSRNGVGRRSQSEDATDQAIFADHILETNQGKYEHIAMKWKSMQLLDFDTYDYGCDPMLEDKFYHILLYYKWFLSKGCHSTADVSRYRCFKTKMTKHYVLKTFIFNEIKVGVNRAKNLPHKDWQSLLQNGD